MVINIINQLYIKYQLKIKEKIKMSINLQKGQKIDLTKTNTGLTKVMIGLGWDTNKFSGDSFDLDSVACLIGESDKVENDTDLSISTTLSMDYSV